MDIRFDELEQEMRDAQNKMSSYGVEINKLKWWNLIRRFELIGLYEEEVYKYQTAKAEWLRLFNRLPE